MFETLMNNIPLNWTLMKNPINWIIIFLMIAIAGAGLAVIVTNPGAANEEN